MNKETINAISDLWRDFTRELENQIDDTSDVVLDFQEKTTSNKEKTTYNVSATDKKGNKIINGTLTVSPEAAKTKKKKKKAAETAEEHDDSYDGPED